MKKRDIFNLYERPSGPATITWQPGAWHFLGFLGTYLDAWPSAIHAIDNDPGVSFEPFDGAATVFL